VADFADHRVLRFNTPFTNGQSASVVLGQTNFTSNAAAAPPTASSLNSPASVTVDRSGNVWVADLENNRVLRYAPPFSNRQAASLVIGQPFFLSKSAPSPPTAASLRNPRGVTVDSNGHLWVVDLNNRILQYAPPFANGQPAAVVIGQSDFVSNSGPNPPTASSLAVPGGAVAFAGDRLWVADTGNNRVLAYAPASDTPPFADRLAPMSPPDFPLKVLVERGCAESFAGRCLRQDIVRLCVGGNCFIPLPPSPPPPCVRCDLGIGVATGAVLGAIGAWLLGRRRP